MYDVIVVGGGTAGCVVAARLSEDPRRNVLLLEAGPDFRSPSDLPPTLQNAYDPQAKPGFDWNLGASVNGRIVPLARGKVMGGSSAVNGCGAMRPNRDDFDRWAAIAGPLWSWGRMLPTLRRLERDGDFPQLEYHGSSGPVPVVRWREDELEPKQSAFHQACLDAGSPACPDINAPEARGAARWPMNREGRMRLSSATTYLFGARARPNLTVRSETTVARIVATDGEVRGVEVVAGADRELIETHEVVLCAGVPMSPATLLRSGIGPAEDLAKLGIRAVADLPGVGARIADQPGVPVLAAPADGACDPDSPVLQALVRWQLPPMASDDAFLQLVGRIDVSGQPLVSSALGSDVAFGILAGDLQPRSRGRVTLRSADPSKPPDIDLGFFSTEDDVARGVAVTQLAYELLTSPAMTPFVERLFMLDDSFAGDSARLANYVRLMAGSRLSPLGGCAMGAAGAPLSVVDERGRVHGVSGLRIADASIVPITLHTGPALACVAIGERIAELMIEEVS